MDYERSVNAVQKKEHGEPTRYGIKIHFETCLTSQTKRSVFVVRSLDALKLLEHQILNMTDEDAALYEKTLVRHEFDSVIEKD